MRKIFSIVATAFAVAAFVACGGNSAPKLDGTEIVKKDFVLIQPTGWEAVQNEDAKVEIHGKDSVATVRIMVEAQADRDYAKELEYYTSDDIYQPVEDFQSEGFTFKVFKRSQNETCRYIFVAPLTAEKGALKIFLSDDRLVSDPITRQIARDIIANIKPAAK